MKLPWYMKQTRGLHKDENGNLCIDIDVRRWARPILRAKTIMKHHELFKWYEWPLMPIMMVRALFEKEAK